MIRDVSCSGEKLAMTLNDCCHLYTKYKFLTVLYKIGSFTNIQFPRGYETLFTSVTSSNLHVRIIDLVPQTQKYFVASPKLHVYVGVCGYLLAGCGGVFSSQRCPMYPSLHLKRTTYLIYYSFTSKVSKAVNSLRYLLAIDLVIVVRETFPMSHAKCFGVRFIAFSFWKKESVSTSRLPCDRGRTRKDGAVVSA